MVERSVPNHRKRAKSHRVHQVSTYAKEEGTGRRSVAGQYCFAVAVQ
jgi:hypothetical protein